MPHPHHVVFTAEIEYLVNIPNVGLEKVFPPIAVYFEQIVIFISVAQLPKITKLEDFYMS